MPILTIDKCDACGIEFRSDMADRQYFHKVNEITISKKGDTRSNKYFLCGDCERKLENVIADCIEKIKSDNGKTIQKD